MWFWLSPPAGGANSSQASADPVAEATYLSRGPMGAGLALHLSPFAPHPPLSSPRIKPP